MKARRNALTSLLAIHRENKKGTESKRARLEKRGTISAHSRGQEGGIQTSSAGAQRNCGERVLSSMRGGKDGVF